MSASAQEDNRSHASMDEGVTDEQIAGLMSGEDAWDVVQQNGTRRIERTFVFPDFARSLEFTNAIGAMAEQKNHHPLIELTWGRVTVAWWTHDIDDVSHDDLVMAAKTSQLYDETTAAEADAS